MRLAHIYAENADLTPPFNQRGPRQNTRTSPRTPVKKISENPHDQR